VHLADPSEGFTIVDGDKSDNSPRRDIGSRMGFRFSRGHRVAVRVFWIAVFIAVFLLFSGVLGG